MENNLAIRKEDEFVQGVIDCIPTLFAYLSIGFACGVVSRTSGMTFIQVIGMSAFVYAGSSQFVAAGMISSMASLPNIIFTIFLVNLRHLLMSASISPYFKGNSLPKNFSVGILLTDESFALASSHGATKGNISFKWIQGVNLIAYVNWIIANGIGAIFGNLIPNYKVVGLDFALSAMFIGLLISSAKENQNLKHTLIIIISSVVTLLILSNFVSSNTGVTLAAIVGAIVGVVTKNNE